MDVGCQVRIYYPFIYKGVIKVDDIYDGKTETEREEEMWNMARGIENPAVIGHIASLHRKKFDIETFLRSLDESTK